MTQKVIRVGILTAGSHPVQTIYLPTLQALPQFYQVTVIHDASHKLPSDGTRTSPTIDGVLQDPAVDLVLNFMPNEFHEVYTIAALEAGKHVMVETPVSLSIPSAKRIIDAEQRAPNNAKVFVACARRYAPCFEGVFKREVASLDRIHYARCRMIAGPHAAHTATASRAKDGSRNGTGIPGITEADVYGNGKLGDEEEKEPNKKAQNLLRGLLKEAFGGEDELSRERVALSQFLASLGSHDLGLLRDTLGYPDAISNISVNEPFYSALFHYTGAGEKGDYPFTLTYETGTDCVPRCDAQLAIYGHTKTVTIHYDLPYARGQPVRVVVETADERGGLQQTESVSTWEETYKEELRALHAYLVEGKAAKTTARDGLQDLKLFQRIFEQYDRQCGTIRAPL